MQSFRVVFLVCVAVVSIVTNNVYAEQYTVFQSGKQFVHRDKALEILTIGVGDSIVFKNKDSLFHNIFSLSKSNKFDLGPTSTGASKTVEFNKKGEVEIECIFHPTMFFVLTVQ